MLAQVILYAWPCVAIASAQLPDVSQGEDSARAATQPNIILILADDLGWRDLGSYGSTFYRTPRLDEFAASGVRFTHAYSAASTCSPTRASILTGHYPLRIGFTEPSGHIEGEHMYQERHDSFHYVRTAGPTSVNYLAEHYYTLGEAMKDAGYSTAFLGKWHLGHAPHIPESNGFDVVVGGRHHAGPPGKNRRRAYFPPWDADTFPAATRDMYTHVDDYLAQRAAEFIAAHRDKPFFMCFWPYSVHTPFQSKPELIEQWQARVDPANPQHNPTMAAMIDVLDTSVGRVLDAVKENGLEQNTIVIFTSDNGGSTAEQVHETTATNNAPLRAGKGSNYDGGVRVPLIVRWPGVTRAGTVSDVVVTSPDHYPTILDMSALAPRPLDHKDGVSYSAALRGDTYERPAVLSTVTQYIFKTGEAVNTSIRENNWKLIRYWYSQDPQTHRYELFDTDADIGETHNLADVYPKTTAYLDAQLEAYYTRNDIPRPMPNRKYDGRSVGLWTSEGAGSASTENGALVLASNETGFSALTYFVPRVLRSSLFEFEARAQGTQLMRVDWLTGSPMLRDITATGGQELELSSEWKRYQVQLLHEGTLLGLRVTPAGSDYRIDIRAARVLSPDNTVMMSYDFN
jgi:arylsulfatase A-like enzyme